MTAAERAVHLTGKMFQCRNAAKLMLGDKYAAEMREYGVALTKISEGKKISLSAATVEAAQHMTSPYGQIIVTAALVELLDPSTPETGAPPAREKSAA
jgi:hypothetical protein